MKNRNLKLFYTHQAFFQFSDSMLIIILPIFIYKLFGTIIAVFLFNFSWNLLYSIIFIPVFNLAMKLKTPKYFMALGILFYILSLILFSKTNTENIIYIVPATILFTLYISFYWMIRHWFFAVNTSHKSIGKQVSIIMIINTIIGFMAPVIAGALSFLTSFNITFLLGALMGIISIIPILLFHAPSHKEIYTLNNVFQIIKNPELKAIRPAYLLEGFSFAFINVCWILAFSIFIGNIFNLGMLIGITTLFSALLSFLLGKKFDKRKRKEMLKKTTYFRVLTTLLYSSIFFFPNIIYVALVELSNKLSSIALYTVADSYLYGLGNKVHPINFALNREILLNISRFFAYGTLSVSFYFLPEKCLWIFIGLGSLSLLGWLSLKKSDHLLH